MVLRVLRHATAGIAVLLCSSGIAPQSAVASKQPIDFFGGSGVLGGQFTSSEDVAVNYTGAGGVPAGTIYATDGGSFDDPGQRGNRVQRFERDDSDTPGDFADDTYSFVAAWGAGVASGGTDYEICSVAAQCRVGAGIDGNGTPAGNGSLNKPSGIAVDQDTGQVFVLDSSSRRTPDSHFRIQVYDASGHFLRAFGYDVVASGPGDSGIGYEVCVADDGDICQAGTPGSGVGQFGASANGELAPESIAVTPPDGNPSTGSVFIADAFNRRVNTYNLDGTSPGSIGSAAQFEPSHPQAIAVDSRGILYAANQISGGFGVGEADSNILRYDSAGANGGVGFLPPLLAPLNETQRMHRNATAGQFRLTFDGHTTGDLLHNATAAQVDTALEALPSVGAGNVVVSNCFCPEAFYIIRFGGSLAGTDVPQLAVSDGATPLTGTISVVTGRDGHGGVLLPTSTSGLAVDPDTDGPGSDTDVLYAARGSAIQQLGPVNAPGLTVPPGAEDDRHSSGGIFSSLGGLDAEPPTGRLYVVSSGQAGPGVYVLDDSTAPPPTVTLDSIDGIGPTSADLHATIDPNGPPATRYHFEYSTDGVTWLSLPEQFLGSQLDPQEIDAHLEPPAIGLEPNTEYRTRVVAGRRFATPVISNELTFATNPSPPLLETVGAEVRTATTAELNGRVIPRNSSTSYFFEYGAAGPCDSHPCAFTTPRPAGAGDMAKLVGEEIVGLQSDTTYHYRLVAHNGVGAPVRGADLTFTTRGSDAPMARGEYPGPPGSDRAWEQVSIADSSGNPVFRAEAFADDGNAAVYGIAGGTPIATAGSYFSIYYADRPPGAHPTRGWQTRLITPSRQLAPGSSWKGAVGRSDLGAFISENSLDPFSTGAIWRLQPDGQPEELLDPVPPLSRAGPSILGISGDGGRVVAFLRGGVIDPSHPAAGTQPNLYEISTQPPRLLSLLPGGTAPPCGVSGGGAFDEGNRANDSRWVSDGGRFVVFSAGDCVNAPRLYLRDIPAEETRAIGPGNFIKQTASDVFFATSEVLDPIDDIEDGGNDVYRYSTGDGTVDCLTCLIPGFGVDVQGDRPLDIAVSDDGARVYFTTQHRLLPGAPPEGTGAIYRLDVSGGELDFVAPAGSGLGTTQRGNAITPDGSTLVLPSSSAALNPLGGVTDNGGTLQLYRYQDSNRSLICLSCPRDGSPAPAPVAEELVFNADAQAQPNLAPLSADGATLAFATPVPLVSADQNTPGPGGNPESGNDIYEWRDGRLLLITDGLTNWVYSPGVQGVSPSGRDIFFTAAARYTLDALDGNGRLYDARIGGGIDFPAAPRPCPLEVCQGTPQPPAEESVPGSLNFYGSGNRAIRKKCAKRKVLRRGRCVVLPCHRRSARRGGKCVERKRSKHLRSGNRRGWSR